MKTVSDFIDELGGTVAVANFLDIAPTTVSSWKTSHSIPKWRMEGVKAFAKKLGKPVPKAFAAPERDAAA